ncbi:hypothetical protein EDD18DRAFT_1462351 [Armillaria luteobubalina]|uniref:Uncharacterized protein n=1 Tax=Armillaria luteobubalina TaxID=153913 RepID=A0AA39UU88_9AGAR|nr:hypothetical protein EDD18DRAFT_1462351 [Armillaria luteobubalina]
MLPRMTAFQREWTPGCPWTVGEVCFVAYTDTFGYPIMEFYMCMVNHYSSPENAPPHGQFWSPCAPQPRRR